MLAGAGPVFNLGERVEAYTSPAWLAVLSFLGALGIPLEAAAVYGGIVAGAAGLGLATRGAERAHRAWSDAESTTGPPAVGGHAPRLPAGYRLPLGALVVGVLPSAAEFVASGLELGLVFLWLGAAFAAVTAQHLPARRPHPARRFLVALLLGAGPLVRPELLFPAALLLGALWLSDRRGALALAFSAAVLPLAYEVFRFGYFALPVPNTALAKEAFAARWGQGWVYLVDFLREGLFCAPVALLAALALVATLRRGGALPTRGRGVGDAARWILVSAGPLGGALLALYVVRLGGDFMHARMLLPCAFAALVPMAPWPLTDGDRPRALRAVEHVLVSVVLLWTATTLLSEDRGGTRAPHINDERRWLVDVTGSSNPTTLVDQVAHPFLDETAPILEALTRPHAPGCTGAGCRRPLLPEARGLERALGGPFTLLRSADARVRGAAAFRAVGIVGYALPAEVMVVDLHGLADPLGARLRLTARGRPGHEKELDPAWVVARLAEPGVDEPPRVRDARAALSCGPIRELLAAIQEPLTRDRFVRNLWLAPRLLGLRIPAEPAQARAIFCAAGARSADRLR